jgi:hypothetical protein
VAEAQRHLARALGTFLDDLSATPAPTMRFVQLPEALLQGSEDAKRLYQRRGVEYRIEVSPILFEEVGYLRVAAAPYNTRDDDDGLAESLRTMRTVTFKTQTVHQGPTRVSGGPIPSRQRRGRAARWPGGPPSRTGAHSRSRREWPSKTGPVGKNLTAR